MRALKALGLMAVFCVVWLLRPIVRVRFGQLFVSRLGHLAANTECYLCERDAGLQPKRTLDIWTPVGIPANRQLLKMFSRVMWIAPWAVLLDVMGRHTKWWKEHQFSDAQWGRDIHNLMEKQPAHLSFTKAEEKRGQEGLRLLGIPAGAKWVCIIARDSHYLKAKEPGADYSYHSFRDSDIQNYRAAAVALMERGYYVVRMGAYVKEPMKLSGPMFIDYPMSNRGSDFMDVYLGAKCAFTISNGTGFDAIPMIFRRPICFVNEAPFEYLSTWMKDSLAIWKHHYKDGKRMSVAEIVASGAGLFDRAQQYKDAGITLVENTPEEIRDVALEMLHVWEAPFSKEREFWKNYPRSVNPHNGVRLHGAIRLRIGSKFLESYEQ